MTHNLTKTIESWDENAAVWDEAMGDGSPFQETLIEPKTLEFLGIQPGMRILDIACGNGQMSRRLAKLGVHVTAIDGSETMIHLAKQRSKGLNIDYHIGDVTQTNTFSLLGHAPFDAALCNMALMDIEDIQPVFDLTYKALKEAGVYVFSINHPCFDKAVGPHLTELHENEGTLISKRFIKANKYLTSSGMKTRALVTLPSAHYFFHRPLHIYLNAAFEAGFVMCAMAEPAFAKESGLMKHKKGWHELSDIPVVFIAKLRKCP